MTLSLMAGPGSRGGEDTIYRQSLCNSVVRQFAANKKRRLLLRIQVYLCICPRIGGHYANVRGTPVSDCDVHVSAFL